MATIGLEIKSDFAQAKKDLEAFTANSEATTKSLEKFKSTLAMGEIDRFIDKQKLNEIAMSATRGEVEASQKKYYALRGEMERLIKNGIDPNSEAIKKLKDEYDKTEKELNQFTESEKKNKIATEAMTKAQDAAKTALLAIGAAAVAAGAMLIKNTFATAAYGDELGETAQKIGLTAESLQEYNYVAKKVGTDTATLQNGFTKLNKNLGELQNGYGGLYTGLKNTNPELLKSLQSAKNSDEAFRIATAALSGMDNQFEKTALAQQIFGKAGAEMLVMTDLGVEGLDKMKNEVRSYGIMTNEQAQAASDFTDAQLDLTKAFFGAKNELAAGLMPAITEVMKGFTKFITEGDGLKNIFNILSVAIPAVTAGLVAFLVVTKGASAINALTGAMTALNIAMTANPVGAIVLGVAALVAALIILYKNWDTVYVFLLEGLNQVGFFFEKIGINISTAWTVAINSIKIAFFSLVQVIFNNVIGAIQSFLEIAGKIPFVGEQFQKLNNVVGGLKNTINGNIDALKAQSQSAIENAKIEKDFLELSLEKKKEFFKTEQEARLAMIENSKKGNETLAIDNISKNDAIIASETAKNLTLTDMATVMTEAELARYDAGIKLAMDDANKKIQIDKEKEDAMAKYQKEIANKRKEDMKQGFQLTVTTLGSLADSISTLMKQSGKDTHDIAVVQKGIALAQVAINTAQGISAIWAQYGAYPYVAAGLTAITAAAGAAQSAVIIGTPIPSAQTGTSPEGLTIPQGRGGVSDRVGVMASPGETISVTPRGESAGQTIYNFFIDKKSIFSVVQDGIESGEINIRTDNIQGYALA